MLSVRNLRYLSFKTNLILSKVLKEVARAAYAEAVITTQQKNKEKVRARAKRNWRRLVTVYFVQKKARRLFGNITPDPHLQKIIINAQERKLDLSDETSQQRKPNLSSLGTSSKQPRNNTKKVSELITSKYFKSKQKNSSEDEIMSDVSEKSAISSQDSSEESGDSSKEFRKKAKQSAIQLPRRKSYRTVATTSKAAYAMSSDSSDISHESDNDWN